MKHLKKHPKQQRMEDMTFPLQKNKPSPVFVRMGDKIIPYRGKSGNKKGTNIVSNKSPDINIFVDTNLDSHTYINNKKVTFPIQKRTFGIYKTSDTRCIHNTLESLVCAYCIAEKQEKVVWEGREWLRSINDDNGFTLMPRLAWRLVAVGVLVGAVIISFYIYGKR